MGKDKNNFSFWNLQRGSKKGDFIPLWITGRDKFTRGGLSCPLLLVFCHVRKSLLLDLDPLSFAARQLPNPPRRLSGKLPASKITSLVPEFKTSTRYFSLPLFFTNDQYYFHIICKIFNKGEGLTYHFAFSFSFGG